MLIPNAAEAAVDVRKLRDYCLNPDHEDSKHEARLFSSMLGMSVNDADDLRKVLLEVVATDDAQLGRRDRYRQRYTLDFEFE